MFPFVTNFSATYLYLLVLILFIGSDITILPSEHLTNMLVYGSNVYSIVINKLIITETIEFIRKSGRFENLEASADA